MFFIYNAFLVGEGVEALFAVVGAHTGLCIGVFRFADTDRAARSTACTVRQ